MEKNAVRVITLMVGLNMVIFGAHQITQPRKWRHYMPAWLEELLPVEPDTAMRLHGTGNVLLGTLFMSQKYLRLSSYLVAAWWAFVLPFCGRVSWRAGVRDASILGSVIAVILSESKRR